MKKIELLPFQKFCVSIGAIPSTYIESLSYYEQILWLCKFLEEQVIPTVNNNGETVSELQNLFNDLQNYIANYFDNLDVQNEINNKLDEMSNNGTLYNIMQPYFTDINNKLEIETKTRTNNDNSLQSQIDIERSRINNISNLKDGSTTGDAELQDIRIDAFGNSYTNAGESVRGQTNNLNDKILELKNDMKNTTPFNLKLDTNFSINPDYFLNENLKEQSTSSGWSIYTIPVTANEKIEITANVKNSAFNAFEFYDGTRQQITEIPRTDEVKTVTTLITVPQNCKNILITSYTNSNIYKKKFYIRREKPQNIIDIFTKISNIFKNPIDGSYIDYLYGNIITNENMCYTDYIEIDSRLKYLINFVYVQLAFYDSNLNYLSGFMNNPRQTYPSNLMIELNVPTNAKYIRISTRKSYKNNLICTNYNRKLSLENTKEVSEILIPKTNVIEENNNILYDYFFNNGIPDEFMTSNTQVSDGYAKCSTNNGYTEWFRFVTIDKSIISAIFKCDENSIIAFGYCSVHYGNTTDAGIYVEIDSTNKKMTAYRYNYAGGEKIKIDETTFNFNVADGNDYTIIITKDTPYHIKIELFNTNCPDEIAIIEKTSNISIFRCWGGARFTNVSGTSYIKRFTMYSTGKKYPKLAIFGDSFIENSSRVWDASYARRLFDLLNGDCYLSGQGGGNTSNLLQRLPLELGTCFPKYVILSIGSNDNNVDTFKENLQKCIELVESINAIPILITVPRRTNNDNLSFINSVNPWIKSLNYNYIDIAMALSTGNGTTLDTTKINNDGVHPNEKGALSIIKWIETNLPELIY